MVRELNECWMCNIGERSTIDPQVQDLMTSLLLHSRMHEQIASFPSKMMYHSKLRNHESVAKHLLRDLPNISVESPEDDHDVLETPVVFFDTAGCEYFERLENDDIGDEGSRCNENEATVVKRWVEQLVSLHFLSIKNIQLIDALQVTVGVLPTQIAIITPCVRSE